MSDTALRLALREMHGILRRPVVWQVMAVVAAVLALSGPFGTLASLGLGARLAYWSVVVGVTATSGWLVSLWIDGALRRRGLSPLGRWAVASLPVAAVVLIEVAALNALAFGISPFAAEELASLALSTVPVAVLVTAALTFIPRAPPTTAAADPLPRAPRLLSRLPLDKRGALISLSVQDHYVEVVTSRGRALLLLRLSDAIAEAEGCPGLQVHRSHWVARDQVSAARREGGRAVLTLADGREIPVSRTYLRAVKEAGLL